MRFQSSEAAFFMRSLSLPARLQIHAGIARDYLEHIKFSRILRDGCSFYIQSAL